MKLVFLFISYFFLSEIIAQDIIYKKSGSKLVVKIISVDSLKVRFKPFDEADTSIYMVFKDQIKSIQYQDGKIDLFDTLKITNPGQTNIDNNIMLSEQVDPKAMYTKGENDAYRYYEHGSNIFTSNFIAGVAGPITILIPIITSLVPPQKKHLGYPDSELFSNKDYKKGYKKRAHKLKSTSTWVGYGCGVATFSLIVGVVALKIYLSQ